MSTARPGDGVKFTGNIDKIRGLQKCGNFDIISDHLSRLSQLHPAPHALCAVVYLVAMLIRCADWCLQSDGVPNSGPHPPTFRTKAAAGSVSATYKGSGGPGVMVDFDELYRYGNFDIILDRFARIPQQWV